MVSMNDALSVDQVAERLGVKRETVYAYVSRGLLTSRRSPDGRTSLFDSARVERMAAQRRRPAPAGTGVGGSSPTIETSLTLLDGKGIYYRGLDSATLARSWPFEKVAWWLWADTETVTADSITADWDTADGDRALRSPPSIQAAVRPPVAALPHNARPIDRFRVAVAVASTADPFRQDLRPSGVRRAAPGIVATMIDALVPRSADPHGGTNDDTAAARLWARLSTRTPEDSLLRVLNGALVVLADHDLVASTLAARMAASTRADPYAVVLTGLGAMDGPYHAASSVPAYRLLAAASEGLAPADALAAGLQQRGQPPGFGNPLYDQGDPRAHVLLDLIREAPVDPERLAVVDSVRAVAADRDWLPNVDFSLAALAFTTNMLADAGEAVFAVARAAGWLAHAIEEYATPVGRFRLRGRYVGTPPVDVTGLASVAVVG
jgi:citrate synthase